MEHNDPAGLAAGYIHSLKSSISDTNACYARFRRISSSTGAWIRGTGIEKPFENEQSAMEWLLSLGCTNDRIVICRPDINSPQ